MQPTLCHLAKISDSGAHHAMGNYHAIPFPELCRAMIDASAGKPPTTQTEAHARDAAQHNASMVQHTPHCSTAHPVVWGSRGGPKCGTHVWDKLPRRQPCGNRVQPASRLSPQRPQCSSTRLAALGALALLGPGSKMQRPWVPAHRCILTRTKWYSLRDGGRGVG